MTRRWSWRSLCGVEIAQHRGTRPVTTSFTHGMKSKRGRLTEAESGWWLLEAVRVPERLGWGQVTRMGTEVRWVPKLTLPGHCYLRKGSASFRQLKQPTTEDSHAHTESNGTQCAYQNITILSIIADNLCLYTPVRLRRCFFRVLHM